MDGQADGHRFIDSESRQVPYYIYVWFKDKYLNILHMEYQINTLTIFGNSMGI